MRLHAEPVDDRLDVGAVRRGRRAEPRGVGDRGAALAARGDGRVARAALASSTTQPNCRLPGTTRSFASEWPSTTSRSGKWKSGASVAAAFTERESGCSSSVARSARSAYSPGAVSTATRAQVNAGGASGTPGISGVR